MAVRERQSDAGQNYSFTFTKPGTYAYYCEYHGNKNGLGMAGTILVTALEFLGAFSAAEDRWQRSGTVRGAARGAARCRDWDGAAVAPGAII